MKRQRIPFQNLHRALNQNLPYLVVLYLLILVLILMLTGQGLLSEPDPSSGINRLIFYPLVIFSFYLIGILVLNLIQLFRSGAGVGVTLIKQRMVTYFVILVLLSTLPQSILSYRLNNASLDYWLDEEMTSVMLNSLEFNLSYYQQELDNLERFSRVGVLDGIDLSQKEYSREVWDLVSRYNGKIDTLQVILPDDSTWLLGDELARVPVKDAKRNGFLSRRDLEVYSILSYQFPQWRGSQEYKVILSSLYPREFNQLGRDLSRILERQEQFLQFRETGGRTTLLNTLFFLIPLLLLSVNIAFALGDRIVDPLNRLERAMDRVSEGDYSSRLSEGFSEDLSHIVGTFNQMINELELSQAKVEQTGRVGAWKDLAQQLAHEIRNPLTPIKLSAQRIQRKIPVLNDTEGVLGQAMERIITEVDGLDYLLKEFRDFAGQRAPQLERLDIYAFLKNMQQKYLGSYENIEIELKGDDPLWINADQLQIGQVMNNLIDNALQAMEEKGTLSLAVYHLPRGNTHYARIVLQDSGPGIPEDLRDKIFQPYFTTRSEGTGLGLAIVERIINDHKGRIWLVSTTEGTTFTLDIPIGEDYDQHTDH